MNEEELDLEEDRRLAAFLKTRRSLGMVFPEYTGLEGMDDGE